MALGATHMRFALDVKKLLKIENIAEYIQGTVYPDSRYVSGISRELTHSSEFLKKEFATNDFKIGWQVHLMCDKIQHQIFHQDIPGFDKYQFQGYQEDQWISSTAAKIIADMNDVQLFDIQSTLKYLNSEFCPNNEDISAIRQNNKVIIDLYQNKKVPTIDDYIVMWTKFAISSELGKKVYEKTEQFLNSKLDEVIWTCYGKMLQAFEMYQTDKDSNPK